MKTKVAAGFSVFLGSAMSALANPVIQGGTIILFPAALFAETFVITMLLKKRGFRSAPTFPVWFFITLVTCGLMNETILLMGIDAYQGEALPVLGGLLVFEVFVVLIEAGLIMLMSKSKRLRDPGHPFTWRSALMVSLIGNLVSLAISLLAIFIPARGSSPEVFREMKRQSVG